MASVNKVILIGNLTRDPELRYTPKGTALVEIGLAVNRKWRNEANELKEEVTFLDVTFWGKQAETVAKWVKKGAPIYVEGLLATDTWDDKTTGQKRYKTRIVAEEFQFLGGKPDAATSQSRPPSQPRPHAPDEPPSPLPDDDIPF